MDRKGSQTLCRRTDDRQRIKLSSGVAVRVVKTIEVTLPEQTVIQLEALASARGLTPQQLLERSVEEALERAREETAFDRIAQYMR